MALALVGQRCSGQIRWTLLSIDLPLLVKQENLYRDLVMLARRPLFLRLSRLTRILKLNQKDAPHGRRDCLLLALVPVIIKEH